MKPDNVCVCWKLLALVLSFPAALASQEKPPKGSPSANQWTYHADLPGVRPVARTISLLAERPEDLLEEPNYRGTQQRYAQLRYGSENSRRVIIAVDDLPGGEVDFYVDADRNRALTAEERIAGTGRERVLDLDAEILQELLADAYPRRISLRLGFTGDRLSIATLGGVVGTVRAATGEAGQWAHLAARRIDGDANGLFADSRDRLQVDLDDNGQFDPIREQFTWRPVMTLAGRRYAVKADRQGESLSLDEITGSGQLQVQISQLPASARVLNFEAMVFSDDGSAWSLKEAGKPEEVPVGRYALGSVTLTVDTGDRQIWHFVFSRNSPVESWTAVTAGGQVSLEAVGTPRFELLCDDSVQRGSPLHISPRLYTGDGLLVNLSTCGQHVGRFDDMRMHNPCEIRLIAGNGATVGATKSGFS